MQYHPAASAYFINIPSSIHQKHSVEKQKKSGPKLPLHQYTLVDRASWPKMSMSRQCGWVNLGSFKAAFRVCPEVVTPQATSSKTLACFQLSSLYYSKCRPYFSFLICISTQDFWPPPLHYRERIMKCDTTGQVISK